MRLTNNRMRSVSAFDQSTGRTQLSGLPSDGRYRSNGRPRELLTVNPFFERTEALIACSHGSPAAVRGMGVFHLCCQPLLTKAAVVVNGSQRRSTQDCDCNGFQPATSWAYSIESKSPGCPITTTRRLQRGWRPGPHRFDRAVPGACIASLATR